jgi:Obg family GTPase CgtA
LDIATIFIKAGNGGDGLVSFKRAKFLPAGGPDGGDGGRGGNVFFEADPSMNTLISFRYAQKFKAGDGSKGGDSFKSGHSGEDIIIKVPPGTVVKDAETGKIIADVYVPNEKTLVLEGGDGGRGNAKFAGATRRSPNFSELGEATVERKIILELKLIADVGLIGFPNVGKSTILSVISAARPKVANYPFTTLEPNLGVVRAGESSFVVADIPGLVEGASEGAGLGLDFLRHIERVRLLLHIIDISGSEGRDPLEDYKIIRSELKKYGKRLTGLPEIIIANKCDLLTDKSVIKALRDKTKKRVVEVSAATTEGIKNLINITAEKLQKLPPLAPLEFEPFEYQKIDKNEVIISKEGSDIYRISGGMALSLARKVVLNDPDSFRWFERTLRENGVIDKLKEKGMKEGDVIRILDKEFKYF